MLRHLGFEKYGTHDQFRRYLADHLIQVIEQVDGRGDEDAAPSNLSQTTRSRGSQPGRPCVLALIDTPTG